MAQSSGTPVAPGIVLVDKEGGWTSHDLVAKARGIFNTRRVGHAGTLDPMATGLVILGVGGATRLLGYVSDAGKSYQGTISLGSTTNTDDADGEVLASATPEDLAKVSDDQIATGVRALTGLIMQRPSNFSAIKVNGVRSYSRARAGEEFELTAREIHVEKFSILDIRRSDGSIEVDVFVSCSSGTYIRALARDLGEALKVGGHLTALRRTSIGGFKIEDAVNIHQIAQRCIPLGEAAGRVLETRKVDLDEQTLLRNGRAIFAVGKVGAYAALNTGGELVALLQEEGERAKPIAVFLEQA
ncbi:MAG: tRNA pseudouridine(55) synthase TruB [Actinobacteria bacterium]|nr:tRNA pseudouridine(55) synthase TruB [Actinomycetota bacterium]